MPKPAKASNHQHSLVDGFARRIKALREGAGLSGAELDRLTGLCPGTTGRLERGDQRVYASHLYRIAQATGVDIEWFYRSDASTPDAGMDQATGQALEKQRLLDAYMRITDPGLKRDVFELVEVLSKPAKDLR